MRTAFPVLLGLLLAPLVALPIPAAAAGCGSGAIGTHRTISLDPSRIGSISGTEKALGLREREVILTFDDGPVPGPTERILDTLAQHCAKATFFSVGKMARAYPEIARRIVREGHTLAHHTHGHERLTEYSEAGIARHVGQGIDLVRKAAYAGSAPALTPFFRYPYLARNRTTDAVVRRKGLIAFGANIDSRDWEKVSPDTIVERVMRQVRAEGRGIILMHDIHARSASALPKLLARLKDGGYRIVHVVPAGRKDRTMVAVLDRSEGGRDEASNQIEERQGAADPATEAARWQVRLTREIRDSFIIVAGSEFAPAKIDGYTLPQAGSRIGRSTRRPPMVSRKPALAPSIRQWALRQQLSGG